MNPTPGAVDFDCLILVSVVLSLCSNMGEVLVKESDRYTLIIILGENDDKKRRLDNINPYGHSTNDIPYLQVYKSIQCRTQPSIMEPKNKFFLFLCKDFVEKPIFYLRISFQVRYGYMKSQNMLGRKVYCFAYLSI